MGWLQAVKSSPLYRDILEDGAVMAAQRLLRRLGQKRFGPIPTKAELGLRCIEVFSRLDHLIDTVDEAKTWEEWLRPHLPEAETLP